MNTTTIHWAAAEKADIEPARVEKPPVGIVVNAWETASKVDM